MLLGGYGTEFFFDRGSEQNLQCLEKGTALLRSDWADFARLYQRGKRLSVLQ